MVHRNQERKAFFSEEKKQKTFIHKQKFFGSFFQKRTSFYYV